MTREVSIASQQFKISGDDKVGYDVTRSGIGDRLRVQTISIGHFGLLADAEKAIADSLAWQVKQELLA